MVYDKFKDGLKQLAGKSTPFFSRASGRTFVSTLNGKMVISDDGKIMDADCGMIDAMVKFLRSVCIMPPPEDDEDEDEGDYYSNEVFAYHPLKQFAQQAQNNVMRTMIEHVREQPPKGDGLSGGGYTISRDAVTGRAVGIQPAQGWNPLPTLPGMVTGTTVYGPHIPAPKALVHPLAQKLAEGEKDRLRRLDEAEHKKRVWDALKSAV
jgi:hypothetical protein